MASHGISRTEYAQRSRDQKSRDREQEKLKTYNELVAKLQKARSEGKFSLDALQLTSDVLKLNPEFYTVWNYRREIFLQTKFIQHQSQNWAECTENLENDSKATEGHDVTDEKMFVAMLKSELAFLIPLLTTYPKCYWIWNHRLWALQQSSVLLSAEKSASFWKAELDLVGMMLGRDMRNFHAWMYRRLVVASIENPVNGEQISLVKDEFEYTSRVVRGVGGMSNYSAWHQRSKLTPRLLKERGYDTQERMDFLEDELELLQRAISTDPDDQSLWFYHRWLVCSNVVPGDETAIAPEMPVSIRIPLLEEQIEMLTELVDSHPNCKYIFKALISYVGLLQSLRKEPPDEDSGNCDVDEDKERRTMQIWLNQLFKIDPMRKGRYQAMDNAILATL